MCCNRICLITLFLIIPLTLLGYFGLNYSGFCFAQIRYLSDEEKLRLAFNSINNAEKLDVENKDGKSVYREQIPYKSFDEYIKENPDCCKINPRGGSDLPPPRFSDRIFGYHSGELIVINFKVRYIDDNGKQIIQETRIDNTLQNCGKSSRFAPSWF
ncbi:MAG: hypothetical protein QNJ63_03365 [Calothrix sp. MO_192.B10]|nr:hypothetical protein [Calothrix sp. MO_192.B10]